MENNEKANPMSDRERQVNIVGLDEYSKLTPLQQGYVSYMQSHLTGSKVTKRNPYRHGTIEAVQWEDGQTSAIIQCQDMP